MAVVVRALLCLAAVVCALGGIAIAAYETELVHRQVLEQLERRLSDELVGEFEAKRLSGTLIDGFTAHDVAIYDGGGDQVAHVDEFRVDASAFALLDGRWRFEHAEIVRPVVLVERFTDGTIGIGEVFDSAEPSGEPDDPDAVAFEMSRAEVRAAQIVYIGSPVLPAHISPMTLDVDSALHEAIHRTHLAHRVDAEGHLRVLHGDDLTLSLDHLEADFLSPEPLDEHHLQMSNARLAQRTSGLDTGADAIVVDDHWRADDIDVRLPNPSSPRPSDTAGPRRPAQLSGELSTPDGGRLSLAGRRQAGRETLRAHLEADDFRAADWPFASRWPWLVLDGEGTVTARGLTDEDPTAAVDWSARGFDVAGERIDLLDVSAHISGDGADIDELTIAGAGFSATSTGRVSRDGSFDLDLTSNAGGEAAGRLASKLQRHEMTDRLAGADSLEVTVTAFGALDRSAREPASVIEHLDSEADWKIDRVGLDDGGWDAAGGSLDIVLPAAPRADRQRRRFHYELSAALHGLEHGAFGAEVLIAHADGQGVFDAGQGLMGLSYDATAQGDELGFGSHHADRAEASLAGALTPSGRGARWPLSTLAARGTFDLLGYRSDRVSARRVATNIDVSDDFPFGRGDVTAHLSGVEVGDRRFRSTEMKLRLYDGPHFKFASKSRIDISLLPDLPIHVDAIGRHGRNLGAISLDDLRVGRPGLRWKLRRPGLVHFRDDAVEVQSLALERGSKVLPFDGVFGRGGRDSFADSLDRLKNEEIRSIFDVLPF